MRVIPLTQGFEALVDDEDFEEVAQRPWHILKVRHHLYAVRRRPITLLMHTFITGWKLVDHINGNGLDNRRQNLRPANQTQNHANSRKRKNTTSPYKGVTWSRSGSKWMSSIRVDGKTQYLGVFEDPIEAAHAYDEAARTIHQEFARLNFPREGEAGALS